MTNHSDLEFLRELSSLETSEVSGMARKLHSSLIGSSIFANDDPIAPAITFSRPRRDR